MNPVADALVRGYTRAATWKAAQYALIALPIGVVSLTAVTTLVSVGAALTIVIIGLPILAATLVAAHRAARWDAALANQMIGAGIALPAIPRHNGTLQQRVLRTVGSPEAWKAVVWFLLRMVLGVVAWVALFTPPLLGFALVAHAIDGALYDAALAVRVLACAAGVAALLLWPYALQATSLAHAAAARPLLGVGTRQVLAEAAERTATAEARTDLARELHDSVGHNLTAAVLQAEAARRVLATDPAYADQALAAIEQQGRAALEDLDRVLAVLRDEGTSPRELAGLEGVDALVANARAAGLPVDVTRDGPLADVPPLVGSVAYRVVQEGLTNAMRHAAGARTMVELGARDDTLTVRVANTPGASTVPGRAAGGTGIPGLRQRVAEVGGVLEAGPREDGGFRLEARLPYRGGDDA